LSGRFAASIESLIVTEVAVTHKWLKTLYGKRFTLNPQYTSNFDLDWP
jgi:hypothetical protein